MFGRSRNAGGQEKVSGRGALTLTASANGYPAGASFVRMVASAKCVAWRAMGRIDDRLKELGVTLPPPRAPLANYVPARRVGNLVYTAGQVSGTVEREIKGKLGAELTVEQGREAARMCALNCLAALLTVLGSLDGVKQLVRVGAFVNSAAGFNQQPMVANGASDLFVDIFGDAGRHARTAVGVNELPAGFAVEVELIAEVA